MKTPNPKFNVGQRIGGLKIVKRRYDKKFGNGMWMYRYGGQAGEFGEPAVEEARKKPSKKRVRLCDKCGANPAQYLLINGEEKQYLCEPSLEDELVDLVTNNYRITFLSGEPGKIQTIEVQE